MMYLVCFAVSIGLAYLAYKTDDHKRFWIFSVASVAVMVLLAGLRDYSIGIDVMGYYEKARYWKGAIAAESLFSYMRYYLDLGYGEPLFALLIGSIAKITGEYRVFLFAAHIVILTGVYVGAFRQRKHVNPVLVLLIFYLLFFNHSLNIIRQYMAMAIVFAAFADIQEKRYGRYCLAVLLAMGFHTTVIIAFGPLLLYLLMNTQCSKLQKFTLKQRELAIGGTLALLVLLFSPIVRLMSRVGVLNERYLFFLEDSAVSPAVIMSGVAVLGLAAVFYFRKEIRTKCEHCDFFVMCSVAYVILLQLTWFVAYGKRIALYFALPDLLTIGLIDKAQEEKDTKTRWIVRGAIIGVALLYWLYVYAFRNASKTMPYLLG